MPDPRAPEQEVISTVLANAVDGADYAGVNLSKLLPAHRGYFQHQVTVMCDVTTTGAWSVAFMPDAENGVPSNLYVDTGQNISLTAAMSGQARFTAALKGIVLITDTNPDSGKNLTIVVTSTKGPLLNVAS